MLKDIFLHKIYIVKHIFIFHCNEKYFHIHYRIKKKMCGCILTTTVVRSCQLKKVRSLSQVHHVLVKYHSISGFVEYK